MPGQLYKRQITWAGASGPPLARAGLTRFLNHRGRPPWSPFNPVVGFRAAPSRKPSRSAIWEKLRKGPSLTGGAVAKIKNFINFWPSLTFKNVILNPKLSQITQKGPILGCLEQCPGRPEKRTSCQRAQGAGARRPGTRWPWASLLEGPPGQWRSSSRRPCPPAWWCVLPA